VRGLLSNAASARWGRGGARRKQREAAVLFRCSRNGVIRPAVPRCRDGRGGDECAKLLGLQLCQWTSGKNSRSPHISIGILAQGRFPGDGLPFPRRADVAHPCCKKCQPPRPGGSPGSSLSNSLWLSATLRNAAACSSMIAGR